MKYLIRGLLVLFTAITPSIAPAAAVESWRGTTDFNWDTITTNWFDTVNLVESAFTGGDFATFDDSGNNTSPITLVGSLLPGSVTINSTLHYTLAGNGKISGSTGLTKTNSGTLTIQTTNDYTGVTTLGGGTVSVSNLANGLAPSSIGAASSASTNLVFDGGTLQYTGPTVSANRGATLNAGGGTIEVTAAASSLTLGGAIVGSSGGNLTKAGSGTLTLSGANTYNGATIISAGTLQLGAAHALPDGTTVKFGAGGNATLDLAGLNQQVAGLVSVANVGTIGNSSTTSDSILFYSTNGGTSTFGGSIVDALGSGTQRTHLFIQSGTLALTGSNSYSATTVVGGTLVLGANGSINNIFSLTIAPNGIFDVSAIASYNLSTNTTLRPNGPFFSATNPPTIIGGTSVNLGSQPISFLYNGTQPLLSIAQGTLSLNGNPITVNIQSPALPAGSYILVHQANGSINSSGSFPQATGSAIAAGTTNYISVNGGDLVLKILKVSTTTVTRTIGTSPSTYGTPLRFHAAVTPAPADGETISFYSGATLIGTATTVSGAADLDIANLPASGSVQTITATYPGDALNAPSTGTLPDGQLVNPATVTPGVTVASKSYDGTTTATITGRLLSGVIGVDDVSLGSSGTATFASANVGTGVSVSVTGLSLSGTTAGNYVLSSTSLSKNANITPATLTYLASPTNRVYATANPDFTGTVIGFVNGETIATATTGTLTFTSPATIDSLPGSYPINGSGLTANFGNYVFTQAYGNVTALRITVNTSPVSLTINLTSNSVIVSWPSDHLGWRLQVQTNSITSGIWTDVAGSTLTNQVVFPFDSLTNAMNVYRLIVPTPTPVLASGLIANTINFGGTFIADSFDSRTNRYSTNGQYDPAKATDHALIASPSLTGFNLGGTAEIAGYVSSQGGLVTASGSTTVGDFGWINSHTKGIQSGHFTNGFNMNFPPVIAPYGAGSPGVKPVTTGTNGATAYDYMLNGGFYYASNLLNTQFGAKMYVASDSVLVVTGAVSLSQITFNPTNRARLSLFFGNPTVAFTANLVNATAPQFRVYTLPSCTYMKITGGTFIGVIYAPGTDLQAEGGANVQGAILARSFQCVGNFNFHSDDAVGAGF